jgi:LemA protein
MLVTLGVIVGVVVLCLALGVTIYNSLVALNRRCDQAGADIEVQLKLRRDLVPNLVQTVKGYAGHERETLEAVMKARNAAASAPTGMQMQAEAALGGALGRLMAVSEAYPDLKANANFADLQAELSDIENKIAAARRYLNSAINEYNTSREQFPANLIGNQFGFVGRDMVVEPKESRAAMEAAPAISF